MKKEKKYFSDEAWVKIEPLLEIYKRENKKGRHRQGTKMKYSMREVLEAIFYIKLNGISFKKSPPNFPSSTTIFRWFQNFSRDQIFEKMYEIFLNDIKKKKK